MNNHNYEQLHHKQFSEHLAEEERLVGLVQGDRQLCPPPQSLLSLLPSLSWYSYVTAFDEWVDVNSTVGNLLSKNKKAFSECFFLINYIIKKHNESINTTKISNFSITRSDLHSLKEVEIKETGITIKWNSHGRFTSAKNNLIKFGFISMIKDKEYNICEKGIPSRYQINKSIQNIFKTDYQSECKKHLDPKSKYNKIKNMGINPNQKFKCYSCGKEHDITEGVIDRDGLPIVHKLCPCVFKNANYKISGSEYWFKFKTNQDLGIFSPFTADIDKKDVQLEVVEDIKDYDETLDEFVKLPEEFLHKVMMEALKAYKKEI